MASPAAAPDRYSRQKLYAPLGEAGQARLRAATVSIVGMGALGCASATLLARSGVGRLRLYDRDFVELDNLQRQVLYDESDAAQDLPKAQAAARRLRAVNSDVAVEPFVVDVNAANVRSVTEGADLVMDGTDNFETRMLINEACLEAGRPWVYAGCLGASAMVMAVVPGRTPCLRCLLPALPPPGSSPTCDTAGILNSAVTAAVSFQVAEATKILAGKLEALAPGVFSADLWQAEFHVFRLQRDPDCAACARGRFDHLNGAAGSQATSLCGRRAVQIVPAATTPVDLDALVRRLSALGSVRRSEFLIKFAAEDFELTVFGDGRAIIQGTDDIARARALYARYIGA